MCIAAEGRTFFIEPTTKATSWEKPAALYWREVADEQVSPPFSLRPPRGQLSACLRMQSCCLALQALSTLSVLLFRHPALLCMCCTTIMPLLTYPVCCSPSQGRVFYFNDATQVRRFCSYLFIKCGCSAVLNTLELRYRAGGEAIIVLGITTRELVQPAACCPRIDLVST